MNNGLENIQRWRCTCAYDGTEYAGWQKQPSKDSVQDAIEQALGKVFQNPVRTIGAGRTDSGVHARGQVFHFDQDWKHGGEKLLQALRSFLPADISPRTIEPVSLGFHALSSSRGKRYIYRAVEGWAMPEDERFALSLKNQKINLDEMKRGASFLLGKHDFSAFSASRGKGERENPVKEIWILEINRNGAGYDFIVEGSGFLYKMVRSIVGGLFEVGRGKINANKIKDILESCERTEVVVSAAAKGLCLDKVYYQVPNFLSK